MDLIKERLEQGKRFFILFGSDENILHLAFSKATDILKDYYRDYDGFVLGERELAFKVASGNPFIGRSVFGSDTIKDFYSKYKIISYESIINYLFDNISEVNRELVVQYETDRKNMKELVKEIPFRYVVLDSVGISVHPRKIVERVIFLYNLASGADVAVLLKSTNPVVFKTLMHIYNQNSKETESILSLVEIPLDDAFLNVSIKDRLEYIIDDLSKEYWEEVW